MSLQEFLTTNLSEEKKSPNLHTPLHISNTFLHLDTFAPTVYETQARKIIHKIMSKPHWAQKISKKRICNQWHRELQQQRLHPSAIDYALAYVAWNAKRIQPYGQPSCIPGVWQADESLIPMEWGKNLEEELKAVTRSHVHPNSGGHVIDIVHPSLYCAVAGVTLVSVEKAHFDQEYQKAWEKQRKATLVLSPFPLQKTFNSRFQWLPSEFAVNHRGSVNILSYINNIDPSPAAYQRIGEIFAKFVPLFEAVLSDYVLQVKYGDQQRPLPKGWQKWYPDQEQQEKDFYNGILDEEAYEELSAKRKAVIPELTAFHAQAAKKEEKVNLKGKTLQVIVKVAHIRLRPGESYEGSWHVEGTANENIVATGIWYYDTNAEVDLGFRQALGDVEYEQDDEQGVKDIYGVVNGETPTNISWGSIRTRKGMALCWPNHLQHCVHKFQAPENQSLHRSVIVFFLVNPSHTVLSTAHSSMCRCA